MSIPSATPEARRTVPWVVVAVGLVVSLMGFASTYNELADKTQRRFLQEADNCTIAVEGRFRDYAAVMYGVAGLFESVGTVSNGEFHNYLETLDPGDRYPAFHSLHYLGRATGSAHSDLPFVIAVGKNRPDYAAILYSEPHVWESETGFVVLSDPAGAQAVGRAVETGTLAASAPSYVIFKGAKEPMISLHLPVYPHAARHGRSDRKTAWVGLVSATLQPSKLLGNVQENDNFKRIRLKILDRTAPVYDSERMLRRKTPVESTFALFLHDAPLTTTRTIDLAGRRWTLQLEALPTAWSPESVYPSLLLIAGLLLTLIITAYAQSILDGRKRAIAIARDMTASLRRNQLMLQQAQRIAQLGSWSFDPVQNVTVWSEETYRIFGVDPAQPPLIWREILALIDPADQGPPDRLAYQMLKGLIDRGQVEFRVSRNDGAIRLIQAQVERLQRPDAPVQIVGTVIDVTETRAAQDRLRWLAHHDDLTGLVNRLQFTSILEATLVEAEKNHTTPALMFIDLDRFKDVNDSLGHEVGDTLLRGLGQRLHDSVGPGGLAARFGGDEFLVLLKNIKEMSDASAVAASILETFKSPFGAGGTSHTMTASIGIAMYPNDGRTAGELLKNADLTMYRSKERGRNQVSFFSSALQQRAADRLKLESELKIAIERNEFILHYQPKFDVPTATLSGFEALVRWQHPVRGLIYPDAFVPLAEETGLILPIGEWVLETACRQNAIWQMDGLPKVPIAVNLSPRQFTEELPMITRAILERAGLDATQLELEITEGMVIADPEETITWVRHLKDLGVRISIDDFGTGYSSLSYLQRLPIDSVKVDRSFIRHVPTDESGAAIARAIISLGHSLGLRVIAEGVERREQLDFLLEHGCDEAQGYFLGKPRDRVAALTLLTQAGLNPNFLREQSLVD